MKTLSHPIAVLMVWVEKFISSLEIEWAKSVIRSNISHVLLRIYISLNHFFKKHRNASHM